MRVLAPASVRTTRILLSGGTGIPDRGIHSTFSEFDLGTTGICVYDIDIFTQGFHDFVFSLAQ